MIVALYNLIKKEDIIRFAPAENFCTFKLGGKLEYLICPKTLDDFCKYLSGLDFSNIKYKVIGNMSNILPSDGLNKGVYITTRYISEPPQIFGTNITANCGCLLSKVCYTAATNGLSGIEKLVAIPATVGGAVYNNAGAFGQCIADTLQSLLVYSKGTIVNRSVAYANLGYRTSIFQTNEEIVLSATFKLTPQSPQQVLLSIKQANEQRSMQQPKLPSAGSVFKKVDGTGAGKLLQQAGLKGKQIGKAQISLVHANFIVNLGGATSADVKKLINLAQATVKQKFNICLQREIEYIGEIDENSSRLSHT